MPVPAFREDGWLPEGHHEATWEEIIEQFSGAPSSQRDNVTQQLIRWRDALRAKGISGRLILNGSFISSKIAPGDFDAILIWDVSTREILDDDSEAKGMIDYIACKQSGFDLLAFAEDVLTAYPDWVPLDAFDRDKITGEYKGVLEVRL
jgi:hypothetical protein